MIAYVLPTRDRPDELARTLSAIAALPPHDAEVLVVDNASRTPAAAPASLSNQIPVRVLRQSTNLAASARNIAVNHTDASRRWIVMLDDDSHPLTPDHIDALRDQPGDVLAVQAEIWLTPPADQLQRALCASTGRISAEQSQLPAFTPSLRTGLARTHAAVEPPARTDPKREAGGLPEVFIGCGVAIRRDAFLHAQGYDHRFHYYAEEYDLAAKLIAQGGRIAFDRRFQVHHRKVQSNRSMNRILRRLVRNNAWVMRRFAPKDVLTAELRRTIARYAGIALKEHAELGYATGLFDLARTLHAQPRTPLSQEHWARFTGLTACREALQHAWTSRRFNTATLLSPGKNAHVVAHALAELGVRVVDQHATNVDADVAVIATLSPGPMLDAFDLLAPAADWIVRPWLVPDLRPQHHRVITADAALSANVAA